MSKLTNWTSANPFLAFLGAVGILSLTAWIISLVFGEDEDKKTPLPDETGTQPATSRFTNSTIPPNGSMQIGNHPATVTVNSGSSGGMSGGRFSAGKS